MLSPRMTYSPNASTSTPACRFEGAKEAETGLSDVQTLCAHTARADLNVRPATNTEPRRPRLGCCCLPSSACAAVLLRGPTILPGLGPNWDADAAPGTARLPCLLLSTRNLGRRTICWRPPRNAAQAARAAPTSSPTAPHGSTAIDQPTSTCHVGRRSHARCRLPPIAAHASQQPHDSVVQWYAP